MNKKKIQLHLVMGCRKCQSPDTIPSLRVEVQVTVTRAGGNPHTPQKVEGQANKIVVQVRGERGGCIACHSQDAAP